MIAYPLLFSRTKNADYRFLAMPPKGAVDNAIEKTYKAIVKKLTSKESNLLPDQPQWLYYRRGNVILWGMASMSSMLSKNYCKDFQNRDTRLFVGIVYTTDVTSLPFGLEYFSNLYESIVSPVWEDTIPAVDNKPLGSVSCTDEIFGSSLVLSNVGLNIDDDICRFFPSNTDIRALISEALSLNVNVSIASGIKSKKSVTDPDGTALMNVIPIAGDQIQDFQVQHSRTIDDNVMSDRPNQTNDNFNQQTQTQILPDHNPQAEICPRCGRLLPVGDFGECRICKSERKRNMMITFWSVFIISALLMFLLAKYTTKHPHFKMWNGGENVENFEPTEFQNIESPELDNDICTTFGNSDSEGTSQENESHDNKDATDNGDCVNEHMDMPEPLDNQNAQES